MELSEVLPIAVPSVFALIAAIFGALYVRKTGKETNDTNAFKVVTDQLFQLNDELKEKVSALEQEMREVRGEMLRKDRLIEERDGQIAALEEEAVISRGVVRDLATYIKLLIAEWAGPASPPSPAPPIDWRIHL